MHYQQVRVHGHVTEGWKTPLAQSGDRVCGIEGCDRVHKGRGLCGMHLQRLRKTGSTDKSNKREYKTLDEDLVRQRCEQAGYTYVGEYVGYAESFLARHNRCGDVVRLTMESARRNRIAEGCSCELINRTHRLYDLGYYLISTWSDKEDAHRRYDLIHHLTCGREFIVLETNLVRGHVSGPHPCNPSWVDPHEAHKRYYAAGGIPDGPYPGKSDVPWIGSCARCGERVSPVWESIQQGRGVCLKCGFEASRAKNRTPDHVILRILETHRVVLIPGSTIPAISSANPHGCCIECGDPVRTKPINLVSGIRSSCSCTPSNYGFDSGAEAVGYLIEKQIGGVTVRKYGICNTSSSRLSHHQTQDWMILDVSSPNAGHVIRDMEREIHQRLGQLGVRQAGVKGKFDGYTETYRPDYVDFEAETFEELHKTLRGKSNPSKLMTPAELSN